MYIANQANPADILKLHNQQEDTILDDVDDTSEDEDDEYDGEFVSQETRSDPLETGDSDSDIDDDKENNNHTNSETMDTSDSKPAIIKKQKVIKRPRGSEYKLIRYFVLFDLTNLELASGKSQ